MSKTAQLDPSIYSFFATLLLCGRLGSHRTWGQLPSGSSVLVFLPIEQISLEKARKVALIEQDGQDHTCKRWGQIVEESQQKSPGPPCKALPGL